MKVKISPQLLLATLRFLATGKWAALLLDFPQCALSPSLWGKCVCECVCVPIRALSFGQVGVERRRCEYLCSMSSRCVRLCVREWIAWGLTTSVLVCMCKEVEGLSISPTQDVCRMDTGPKKCRRLFACVSCTEGYMLRSLLTALKTTTLFAYTRSSVTSRPGFLAYNRSSHTSRHTWLLTSVKCEIFHPLSLGKWISGQAASTTTPAAAVHYASLQLDLL